MKMIDTIRSHLLHKMLCLFLVFLLLPCLLFAAAFFFVNQTYFSRERASLEMSAMSRCCFNIQQDLDSCANVYKQIQQHSNFLRFLNGSYQSVPRQLEAYFREFSSMFHYAESYSPYIESVNVYTLKEGLLNMNDNVKGISQLGDYAFDMRTAAGFWRYDSQKKMLVYRQTLNSLGGDLGLGILEINCRPSLVSQQAVELSGSIGRVVYVVIDGVCYLPEDGALSPEAELITVKDSQGESLDDFALTIQTGEYYPQERNQSLNLLTITILVGLLLLVLSSCLFFFSISRLSGRIVRFSRYISSSFTEIPGAYTDPGHDELSLVVHNFNLMLERNSDLINQIKLEQLRQNEMAYQVLQAQIDPHFLYNTLESVRMMAEMKDEPEISDMIFSLSKLMRYSFSVNTGLVTVGDELDLVSQFLKVQKMRLGEQLRFSISCPKEPYGCRCPQFIIQPLAENAIKYGRDGSYAEVYLSITLNMEGGFILVTVENNGAAMGDRRMARINQLLSRGEDLSELSSGTGVGLDSINNRMRYLYPDSFSMELSAPEGGGLRVSLRWRPETESGGDNDEASGSG